MSVPIHPKPGPGGEIPQQSNTSASTTAAVERSTRGIPKRASVACESCKRKKAKCTGECPCALCIKLDTECIFDVSKDGRREKRVQRREDEKETTIVKRKIEEIEQDLSRYERLINRLRRCESPEAEQVLSLVRSSATAEEVFQFIESRLTPERTRGTTPDAREEMQQALDEYKEDQESESSTAVQSSRPLRSRFISSLCDEPILQVPAKPWTDVTEDSEFVSHLVSLWFTWQTMLLPHVDKDLFIHDMNKKTSGSLFCSRFLVNAICADACGYSDYPEANAVPSDKTTAGAHFQEAAVRELELEVDKDPRPSLTRLQGLLILGIVTGTLGHDREGMQYLMQIGQAAEEWRGRVEEEAQRLSPDDAADLLRATDQTIWGVYNTITAAALSYRMPPIMQPPSPPQPMHADSTCDGNVWLPYPLTAPSSQVHEKCFFNRYGDLSPIVYKFCSMMYAPSASDLPSKEKDNLIIETLSAIDNWRASLPACLQISQRCPPHVLSLNMYSYAIGIAAAGAMRPNQEDVTVAGGERNEAEVSALPLERVEKENMGEENATLRFKGAKSKAHETCLANANEIARLARIFQATWDFHRPPIIIAQWISVAAFGLLEGLADPECRSSFIDICIFLRTCSRRWVLFKGVLRLLQLSAKSLEVALPESTVALFEDFQANAWSADDTGRFLSSYPDLATAFSAQGRSQDDIELDQVLKRWEALELE